jgi:hypothetical protein
MRDWIIISPEGVTIGPNDSVFENFQVLSFIQAESEDLVVKKLKEENEYLHDSGFDEIWIYRLININPYITYLGKEKSNKVSYECHDEKELVEVITKILKENGFTNTQYDYHDENSYYFEAFSDAPQEIRVDIDNKMIKVYDRYISEKHYVYFGEYQL